MDRTLFILGMIEGLVELLDSLKATDTKKQNWEAIDARVAASFTKVRSIIAAKRAEAENAA